MVFRAHVFSGFLLKGVNIVELEDMYGALLVMFESLIFSRLYCTRYHLLLASYCCLSVYPSVTLCIVVKQYILQQKCLKK